MLNVLCFWFGALLAGLDSLILAVFAQMKQSVRNRLVVGQANFVRPTFLRRELSFIFGASGFSDHNYRLNDFFNGTVGLQPLVQAQTSPGRHPISPCMIIPCILPQRAHAVKPQDV